MSVRLFVKRCGNVARVVRCQIMLTMTMTMTMTMSLSIASESTDGLLPKNQRLFFTPAQRASSGVGADVEKIPERVLGKALDRRINVPVSVESPAIAGSANSNKQRDSHPDIRFEGLVSSGLSHHVLINNVPCQTGKPALRASLVPLVPLVPVVPVLIVNCPNQNDLPYRLTLQMNELKLLIHRDGQLLGQLEVGQRL